MRAVGLNSSRLDGPTRLAFLDLLDRIAAIRLTGRQAALEAAAACRQNVTVELPVCRDELSAMAGLTALLERVAGPAGVEPLRISPEVRAMRSWLAHEAAAQHRGEASASYSPTSSNL